MQIPIPTPSSLSHKIPQCVFRNPSASEKGYYSVEKRLCKLLTCKLTTIQPLKNTLGNKTILTAASDGPIITGHTPALTRFRRIMTGSENTESCPSFYVWEILKRQIAWKSLLECSRWPLCGGLYCACHHNRSEWLCHDILTSWDRNFEGLAFKIPATVIMNILQSSQHFDIVSTILVLIVVINGAFHHMS